MNGDQAKILYDYFLKQLELLYKKQQMIFPGAFGEHMHIEQVNDGPVTIAIDSIKDPKAVAKWEKEKARQAKMAKQKEEKSASESTANESEKTVQEEEQK